MLKSNIEKVLSEIKNGNNLGEDITLVGATKTMDVDTINSAISFGLKVVAENRVQEFNQKHELILGAEQHFIGHLQTNKVKYLVGKVALIHSVDSIHLAQEINRCAFNKGVTQNVLIEINVGGELSKSGFDFDNAEESIKEIVDKCPNVKVTGLMAMFPRFSKEQVITSLCLKMRALYDKLKGQGFDFKHLSMGMSEDYLTAIKNGSNMIRLGRTIFGERNYGDNK